MTTGIGFEEYLSSKKIDSAAFRSAEPELWENWRREFEQMHALSFTMQKLNLINPIRRKYQLVTASSESAESPSTPTPPAVARPGKPMMRPKPKTNPS